MVPSLQARKMTSQAERWTLLGRVQGVGARPALARLAGQLGLTGLVRNTEQGVELEIEGTRDALDAFRDQFAAALPHTARLQGLHIAQHAPRQRHGFAIDASTATDALSAQVPTDLGVCQACLAEAACEADARYGYPFTCCTDCGPRYSLIRAMPYDRPSTSMGSFVLCGDCRSEYESPMDRRFHAETIACPRCGPRVWIAGHDGGELAVGASAVSAAVEALCHGKILALRGVGGYQLLVDATNDLAVARLRQNKRRPSKPLALLVATMAAAEALAHFDNIERQMLAEASNPIVIVRRWSDTCLTPGVCGPLDTLGVMLPATTLHWQLATRVGRPLVATSGNVDGDPLAVEVDMARSELSEVADCWLHHDRPILRPIDDSVVRAIASRAVSLRLARGMAPLALTLESDLPILAVGGHQKVAIAYSNARQAALGPHLGDLNTQAVRDRFVEHVASFVGLYGAAPALIAHDLHPEYFTTRWAAEQGIRTLAVQHHHAHAAAAMLQQDWLDREVLALTWDGTGYGPDGTIWGGECLLATTNGFRRVAHLRPFSLPGGEAAIREPWRVAIALVGEALGLEQATRIDLGASAPENIAQVARLAKRAQFAPRTTSMGRLFDGVASLVCGITRASFEGEPAQLLEAACDRAAQGCYSLPLADRESLELDWRPLVVELLADRQAKVSPGVMAMRFHRAVANAAILVAQRFPDSPVVLTGGVFQNRMLVELIAHQWPLGTDHLGLPGVIPPGDGGLAAGQLAIAAAHLRMEGAH